MKTKQTQEELVAEFIRNAGFITTRHAQQLHICSPNEIIRRIKRDIGLSALHALTKEGKRIKIHYTSKKAALGYVKFIGGRVA
jgi:hypothetical protein